MGRGIHDYDIFCEAYDTGNVTVNFLRGQTLEYAKDHGWRIRWWRTGKDFLNMCRRKPENFELAYNQFAADFYYKY